MIFDPQDPDLGLEYRHIGSVLTLVSMFIAGSYVSLCHTPRLRHFVSQAMKLSDPLGRSCLHTFFDFLL